MTRTLLLHTLASSLLAATSLAGETGRELDIRRAAPPDAYMALHVANNPERDAHWPHWRGVLEAIGEEEIGPRLLEVATSRMDEDNLAAAEGVFQQLRSAVESANLEAILQAEEVMYAQVMEMPTSQHLLVLRMETSEADGLAKACEGLLRLIESWSEGKATVTTAEEGSARLVVLRTPDGVNVQPAVARIDDLVLISTKERLLREGLKLLSTPGGPSKFDDPRLQEALSHLPTPEDAVIFFDGKNLFERIGRLGPMIEANSGNSETAVRIANALRTVLDAVDIIDYEVTVEYTEGFQQRMATLGKFTADAHEKMLYQALSQGEPFENWEQWIPADATAYSLQSGISLSVVYEWIDGFLREQFPESHEALSRWETLQEETDFHLKNDLLDALPGGCVSVSFLLEQEDGTEKSHQVLAVRTTDGQGVLKLIERGVDALNHFPVVNTQGLRMSECPELEGFWELHANVFPMFAVRPVFGIEGQWLVFSDSPQAIEHVYAVRAGETESILASPPWKRLDLDVSGEVYALKYSDVGAAVEQAAQTVEQIGVFAPIAVGMAGAQADPEVVAAINEVLAVLPSVAKVIRELDFLEDSLSVTRPGPLENSYRTDWVIQLEPIE